MPTKPPPTTTSASPPPPLLGDPKSWRKFVVALLPHNGCYERHTDDHIRQILGDVLDLSSSSSTKSTPRHKSVFHRLDVTNLKAIQDRMKVDEKLGLLRKKQQVEEAKKAAAQRAATLTDKIAAEKQRAAQVAKKSKHMSRAAREKLQQESQEQLQQLEQSLLDGGTSTSSTERDPIGVTGALANLRAPPSPVKGGGKASSSGAGSSGGNSSSGAGLQSDAIPATEDEGRWQNNA
jgi:hypothetical protein